MKQLFDCTRDGNAALCRRVPCKLRILAALLAVLMAFSVLSGCAGNQEPQISLQTSADGGFRAYEVLEKNGIRCAFLGFTQTTNGHRLPEDTPWSLHTLDNEDQVLDALAEARADADLVVVFVHWGTEYAAEPDETQLRWARLFAEGGADVVLGTHPHVLQPVEWVEGRDGHKTLVYYSLGNCISAQTDPACRLGGLAWFTAVLEDGVCRIAESGLKTVETLEETGRYTVALVPS